MAGGGSHLVPLYDNLGAHPKFCFWNPNVFNLEEQTRNETILSRISYTNMSESSSPSNDMCSTSKRKGAYKANPEL